MSLPTDPPGPDDEGPRLGAVDDAELPVLNDRVALDEAPAGAGPEDGEAALVRAIDEALAAARERLLHELAPLLGGRGKAGTKDG